MKTISQRNYSVDLLRFIAAIMVALFHFNEPIKFIDNFYRSIIKYGWLGVPIFFVISGYCIMISANSSKNAVDFIIKRIFRIYPAYWFSLIVVLVVIFIHIVLFKVNDVANLPKNIVDIASTIILYIQPISHVEAMSWVYWSLACEICFYLIIFSGLLITKKYIPILIIIITILSCGIINTSKGNWWYFLKDWPCFALGISLYYYHYKNLKREFIYSLLILIVSCLGLIVQNPIINQAGRDYLFVSFFTFLILLLSKNFKPNSRYLQFLGDYSYSIYLLHIPIGIYILSYLKTEKIQSNLFLNLTFDIFSLLVIIYFSYLTYNKIEKPFMILGKKIIKRRINRHLHVKNLLNEQI